MLQECLLDRRFFIIIILLSILIVGYFSIHRFFNSKLNHKLRSLQQEQQISIEQLNNKLAKTNKQLNLTKEENKHLQSVNQSLEKKIKDLQLAKQDTEYEIMQLKNHTLALTQEYGSEKNNLLQKINALNKNNSDSQELIKELQLQIKNHKDNTYSLFQAGKLEVELSNVEKKLSEQYENILQRKSNLNYLKDKCGTLRTNNSFCKEYDTTLDNIVFLEQQIALLTSKRDDLKQRINAYLVSSK